MGSCTRVAPSPRGIRAPRAGVRQVRGPGARGQTVDGRVRDLSAGIVHHRSGVHVWLVDARGIRGRGSHLTRIDTRPRAAGDQAHEQSDRRAAHGGGAVGVSSARAAGLSRTLGAGVGSGVRHGVRAPVLARLRSSTTVVAALIGHDVLSGVGTPTWTVRGAAASGSSEEQGRRSGEAERESDGPRHPGQLSRLHARFAALFPGGETPEGRRVQHRAAPLIGTSASSALNRVEAIPSRPAIDHLARAVTGAPVQALHSISGCIAASRGDPMRREPIGDRPLRWAPACEGPRCSASGSSAPQS